MNTDRELLELAAKAAGLQEWGWMADTLTHVVNNQFVFWSPLTDDGDALRLFTKLPFRELYVSEIGATVSWRRDESPHGFKCDEYASEHGGDIDAATRRAIVRAAAFVGEGLTKTSA